MRKFFIFLLGTLAFTACGDDMNQSNDVDGGYASSCSKDQSGMRVYITDWDHNIFIVADLNCP